MSDGNNGVGFLSMVLGILVIWALLFGVTIDGKHYGLRSCDEKQGVVIDR